jgi:hypothetical protein
METVGPGSEGCEWVDGVPEPTLRGIVHLSLYLSYYYAYRPFSFRFSCLNYDLQLSIRGIVSITDPDTGDG